MAEPIPKRLKSTKTIGTHSGTFHADEALGVSLLRLTNAFRDADVVRTRDPARLAPLDIVIDVGGVYDPQNDRYDHHQRGFEEVFGTGLEGREHDVKLSSAGLVYKHFGKEIIRNVLSIPEGESDDKITLLWHKMYKEFVEAIDAVDNGIALYPTSMPGRYASRGTDLSARVGYLNPRWNEESNDTILDSQFQKASALAGGEFLERLSYYSSAWLPARDLVLAAIEKRGEVEGGQGAVLLFNQSLPWKEHLYSLEKELGLPSTFDSDDHTGRAQPPICYVLYPDGDNWRVQCVPVGPESFASRRALPEKWRGVRDEDLSALTGIDGCIFCHASGFIGGNKTKEGALEMARRGLKGE